MQPSPATAVDSKDKLVNRMKYNDTKEKSAEFLRVALPHMTKHSAAMNPVTFAVWYEFVSGCNASLKQDLSTHLANGVDISDRLVGELFRRYVADMDEEMARRVSEDFQKTMADISSSAARVGDQAGEFGVALEKYLDAPSTNNAGAGDILGLTKGMQGAISSLQVRLEESRREVEQLREEVIKAREDAMVDGLTGLANRRAFSVAMRECLAGVSSGESESGPCLLIADIDHFKSINDNWGHLFGDKVLQAVARILKGNVKGQDTVVRYGGEEFVVLLPDTRIEGAQRLAEVIRSKVERCRIKRTNDNEAVANITISLGVASHGGGETADAFVARADAALYESKNGGRNRVTLAQPPQN